MTPPRRIVFDFGGVVFGWQPDRLLRRALPHVVTSDADAAAWVRLFFQDYGGDWGDFDRGLLAVPELVERIARRTGLAAADVQRVVDGVPHELQPQPATVALLRRLHAAGHPLYYLSNMPAPFADLLEARDDFFDCFSDGVFSGRVRLSKPDPAIYALAEQRFGASAQELLFIDDHEPNVVAAREQGWQALHFRDVAQTEAQLRAAGCLA